MLAAVRAFSKSWVAIVLFMILLVAMVAWGGAGKMLEGPVSMGVVTAGSHSVSASDYETMFKRQLDAIGKQQGGPPPSKEEAIKAGFHTRILQGLAEQAAFSEAISKLGISVSPKQFAEKLQEYPVFFDEVTGKFDDQKFKQLLAQNGITPATFKRDTRDEIAFNHLVSGLQAGLVAPRAYGALMAVAQFENRTFSTFLIDESKVAKPAAPTDAQLTAFMNENADRLRRPETRELSYVRFSTKALEATMPVDPAALQKLYDFKKDTMSKPEMRSLVQIPVKNAGQATQVAQRLKAGEDPAAVAKSVGAEPVSYLDKPKSAITDRKVADAAFGLAAGAVSGAVQGDLGMSVIKILDIKPELTVGLEQARPELEKQIKHDAAQKKVYEQVEAFDKATDSGAKMADAAKTVGATVLVSAPVAANGATEAGKPPEGATPQMIAKAFEMAQGEQSDSVDEGEGEYFVVRVDKVIPAALPKLDDIRAELTKAYTNREIAQAMKAKGDELIARIKKGESFEAAATSIGASVNHVAAIDRGAAQQQSQTYGVPVLQAVFGGVKGDVISAGAPKGLAIVRIDDIQPGAIDQLAKVADAGRSQANGGITGNLVESARAEARRVINPKVDVARANKALGINPEPAQKAPADTPPKKAKG